MKRIIVCVIYIILFLNLKPIHSSPKNIDRSRFMSKSQVLRFMDKSIRDMFNIMGGKELDDQSLSLYINMVKSLSVCVNEGSIKKEELVSCLNNVMTDNSLTPPVEFLNCLGEYLMCTGRACFSKIKSDDEDDLLPTCLADCLPRAILCIARTKPVPQRYTGL